MDDNSNKQGKRKNKFAGKENISRETVDNILSNQIDRLREISRTSNSTAAQIQENVNILYKKHIQIDTAKFEQLSLNFINEMENKLQKAKQPSRGMKWYIAMWMITLVSAFLSGYFIHEYWKWKKDAVYWHKMYEKVKEK